MSRRETADLRERLARLVGLFRETLREAGEPDTAERLPWLDDSRPAQDPSDRESLVQALSICFQLLNLLQSRGGQGEGAEQEWDRILSDLVAAGIPPSRIAERLAETVVEPVLTAHPTEAKRVTVLELHRELEAALDDPDEERRDASLRSILHRLWRTGEILLERPDVEAELATVLHHLESTLVPAPETLDARLRAAWIRAGLPPEALEEPAAFPLLHPGTWIGGDRDGHPFVTGETTRRALGRLREAGVRAMDAKLERLVRALSISRRIRSAPAELEDAIREAASRLGERADRILERNPEEPWRQFAGMLRLDLAGPGQELSDVEAHLSGSLALLDRSLRGIGAGSVADREVFPVRRHLENFGLSLAFLDIRQNSAVHDRAMDQLLSASGSEASSFSRWPEDRRVRFLREELRNHRPFAHPDASPGEDAETVLAPLRAIAAHRSCTGATGVRSYVVSMTRSLSDLLVVALLQREAGLWESLPLAEADACLIPIVPLFETLEDLEAAPAILDAFLSEPIVAGSLELRRRLRERRSAKPVQDVMIGYSDSNKDGGILASQWLLLEAQRRLVAVGRDHGTRIRFFHGKGGTISRGAGPVDRFLEALPPASLASGLSLTEQGETVSRIYARPLATTARLEHLFAGAVGRSLRSSKDDDAAQDEILAHLGRTGRREWAALVGRDGFLAFHRQATPIDVIERSRIGSRPSRRTGKATLQDLRAIPWVFSWNQSRFAITGWYGTGTALAELRSSRVDLWDHLQRNLRGMPRLRWLLSNVETVLCSIDTRAWPLYASLCGSAETGGTFLSLLRAEHDLARRGLEDLAGSPLEEHRPRLARDQDLRRDPLLALHRMQVDQLREWRPLSEEDPLKERGTLRLLATVNAIASGLGGTG